MKNMSAWAGALALAVFAWSQTDTKAAYTNSDGIVITNAVVLITTRTAVDAFWRQQSSSPLWDADDAKGPGVISPGDAAMGELLGDYGYTVRIVPEEVLHYENNGGTAATDWLGNPNNPLAYYQGVVAPVPARPMCCGRRCWSSCRGAAVRPTWRRRTRTPSPS